MGPFRCFNGGSKSKAGASFLKYATDLGSIRMFTRLFCCLYITISLPLRAAFFEDFDFTKAEYLRFAVLDNFCTLFFVAEIIGSYKKFRSKVFPGDENSKGIKQLDSDSTLSKDVDISSSFIHESAAVHLDGSGTAEKQVLSFSFLVELLATLPLEYLLLASPRLGRQAVWFMMNRVLRVVYLPIYTTELTRWFEDRRTLTNIGLQRTWKLFSLMAITGHWCACIFFFIAKRQAENGVDFTWPQSDGLYYISQPAEGDASSGKKYEINFIASSSECYIRSLYWAYITMITTGFGDIVPLTISETAWCIISMYLGVLITTCAIHQVIKSSSYRNQVIIP